MPDATNNAVDDPSEPGGPPSPHQPTDGSRFITFTASEGHICALRENGVIECLGNPTRASYGVPPEGRFVALAGGWEHHFCAVEAQTLDLKCWGHGWGEENAEHVQDREGPFVAVSAALIKTCALDPEGYATCWGGCLRRDDECSKPPPDVAFDQIDLGLEEGGCGVTLDGEVVCWGEFHEPGVPTGEFQKVSVDGLPCGLRSDGNVACWGQGGTFEVTGTFIDIDSDVGKVCAIQVGGEVGCWDDVHSWSQEPPPDTRGWPPAGLVLSAFGDNNFDHFGCGIDPDGEIVCWGDAANFGLPTP